MLSQQLLNATAFLMKYMDTPVGVLKLQKLLYYGNAWNIAIHHEALFPDTMEASKHGVILPVFHAMYSMYPSMAFAPETIGDPDALSHETQVLLSSIADTYGIKTDYTLRQLIKEERPWVETYQENEPRAISPTIMLEHFQQYVQ